MKEFAKAEAHFRAILKQQSAKILDWDASTNFSNACVGLARIAIERKESGETIRHLQKAMELNPRNSSALQLLASEQYRRGEYRDGEKSLLSLFAMLPKVQRRTAAEAFVKQFDSAGKTKEAVRAYNFIGWAFAMSPKDNLLDPEAAIAFAKHAVEITKEQDPSALDTLAAAQAANGKYKEAAQTAQAAIKLANSQDNKPLADAISERLQLYQKEKPYRCQLKGSDTTVPNAEDAAECVTRAKAHLDKEEYDKAIADCDKALELDPKFADAYRTRSRAWYHKGEFDKLMADCNQALAINPQIAEAYIGRAIGWEEKDEHDKAIADCNRALAIDPKIAEAYNTRGLAWKEKREYTKALADYNQALTLNPKLAEAYNNRGEAWRQKGEFDKALVDYNQALAINPKFANAYNNRGVVWAKRGEGDKALADCKQALSIAPDNWDALNNLGVCLWKQAQEQDWNAARAEAAGDREAAKAFHQKSVALKNDAKAQWIHAVTVHPAEVDTHSNLGYAYSEANDLDKAEQHLDQAVTLKPTAPRPRNNLGRVLLRRSQPLDADARAAEAKGKTDPVEAGKAKQFREDAKKKRNDAIEQFEKAVELDPTLLEAHLNLGEVYLTLAELDKSAAHYRAILNLLPNVMDRETINNFSQAQLWVGESRSCPQES